MTTKNDSRLSILAGSLSMSLNLTEGFTFLEQTIGEESSTWIIHARPVPQDEPLNDSFFLNGRSLRLLYRENLEPNRRRPQLNLLKINRRVNDLLETGNAFLSKMNYFQFIPIYLILSLTLRFFLRQRRIQVCMKKCCDFFRNKPSSFE